MWLRPSHDSQHPVKLPTIFHTNAIRVLNNDELPGKRNYTSLYLQKHLFGTSEILYLK
jgi:hypothetical protein